MKKFRKQVAVIVSVLMVFSMIPSFSLTAFAEEEVAVLQASGQAWDGTVDISWYDPSKTDYYISTPAQLAGVAALVNGMTDPECPNVIGDKTYLESIAVPDVLLVGAGGGNVSDTVYVSRIDFAYKTIYITENLDMGGRFVNGVWTGPNYTPIGGKFPMKPKERTGDCLTLDTRFNGVLDGQGHTISNLYCDRYAEKGFPYSMAVGVVGFLGGESDSCEYYSTDFKDGWRPSVKNFVLDSGYIKGRRMVGGVVGRVGQTSDGVIIENCANYATVFSTDSKGIGGILGTGWGTGVIRNCYNAGNVSTTYAEPAGGIIGTNQGISIYCCYNIGKIDSSGNKRGRAIGNHESGSYEVANTLYLAGTGDDPNNPGYYLGLTRKVTIDIKEMSESDLKSSEAYAILNQNGEVYVPDTKGINNGYPVFWYQTGTSGGNCNISLSQSSGGTFRIRDGESSVAYGRIVQLDYKADSGYTLDTFLVNGKEISADYFTATSDATVTARFKKLGKVTISIPESRDYYVAVSRRGLKPSGDDFESVDSEMLRNGDTVVEGNILTVKTCGYKDAAPEDVNLEYVDAYAASLPGTSKNSDGTYTVTGKQNVDITVTRKTQKKAWINHADTDWYTKASLKKTYVLTTPEQLAGLAYLVNKSGVRFENITIKLGNDICLENTDGTAGTRVWTPIGSTANKSFAGTFDGQGYAVYDLEIESSSSYAGLFGCCSGASIKNVDVYGTITSKASAAFAGGIAAYMSGGSVTGCSNFCEISAVGTYAGGIAAYTCEGAVIQNCMNEGSVTAGSGAGGILGVSDSGTDRTVNCANFKKVSTVSNGTYGTGGIAGKLGGIITGCVNVGDVSGTDRYAGGLAGYTATKNYSAMTDCANSGSVTCSNATSNAAVGGLAGYAQFLTLSNCVNSGKISGASGFVSSYKGGDIGRSGSVKYGTSSGSIPTYAEPAAKNFDRTQKTTFTITFIADGKTVSRYEFKKASDRITEPEVPQKEGYIGYWDHYTMAEKNLIVKAVYRQNLIKGGETITENGTYHIAWFSSGTITVADGLNVTIDGINGGDNGFDNLAIVTGKNVSLTLKDTVLNSENTMLTMGSDSSIILEGRSELLSNAFEAENQQPAMKVKGNLTISGDGELYIQAGTKNSCVLVERSGSTVELKSGILTIYKDTLLGMEGGAFYANGSKLKISGGIFRGRTDSDNVSVISADEVSVSAGKLMVQGDKVVNAVAGNVVTTGGTVCAYSHTPNSDTEHNIAYNGRDCFSSYTGTATISDFLPFTDVSVTDSYYDAVENCYRNGYFNGTTETTFSPDVSMTRAMFVTVLYRLAGQPVVSDSGKFTDLKSGWYRSAVYWAVEKGITLGTSDTEFSPDAAVTKEQAAVFLYRYARGAGADVSYEDDVNLEHGAFSSWAENESLWALNTGLFAGAKNAMAKPQEFASRSLLATVLTNYSNTVTISRKLPFTDVSVTDSYYDAIEFCYNKGYFNGTSETTFSPDLSMTRAMFVTVLYRLAGQPSVSDNGKFTDLSQSWYRKAVYWAVEKGITLGTSETQFSPENPVTKEQAAVFLYRYAKLSGVDVSNTKDLNLEHGSFSKWAEKECLWALNAGMFAGAENAMSNPQAFAPRSFLATVLANYSRTY